MLSGGEALPLQSREVDFARGLRAGLVLARQAIANVRALYPVDVFPENSDTLDSKSARMARLTCDNVLRELEEQTL